MSELENLVEALPRCVDQPALDQDAPPEVAFVSAQADDFVSPELRLRSGDFSGSQLVLVSAPGAVGKSMLAREIAFRTGGLLWDLSSVQVGTHSLRGMISGSFGYSGSGPVAEAMADGRFLIVMDALDEAAVRAGDANLEAFLTDMASELGRMGAPLPPVVLLARGTTAEIAQMLLEYDGLPVAHLSIDYFDQQRAERFIDLKLDAETTRHRDHRKPFEDCRSMLFDRVFRVLGLEEPDWTESEAREFIGYAPVLGAIAKYLNHENYGALLQEMADGRSRNGGEIWTFLIELLEGILEREQGKLHSNLPPEIKQEIDESGDAGHFYDGREQAGRLLARAMGTSSPRLEQPLKGLDEYEASVSQLLQEHPFLGNGPSGFANVVFRDYLIALALVQLVGQDKLDALTFGLNAETRPSPVLARLAFSMASETEGVPHFDSPEFPLLYESIRSEDDGSGSVRISIEEDSGEVIAQALSDSGADMRFAIRLGDGEEVLVHRRLSHANIVLKTHAPALGNGGYDFTIGPNVAANVSALTVGCTLLRVETRNGDDGGVFLAAHELEPALGPREIQLKGPGRLEIATPETPPHPWAPYGVSLPPLPPTDEALNHALNELRDLVTRFKSEGYEGLGTFAKPLDAAAAKGRASQSLLEFSLAKGLISKRGGALFPAPRHNWPFAPAPEGWDSHGRG